MKDALMPENLIARLSKRNDAGLLRVLKIGDELIDFCSNDYLGLARRQEIYDAVQQEIDHKGIRLNGSTGSRLIRGNSRLAEELEVFLADFHHAEAALIFNSGYDANLGFFSSVPQRGDTILYDRLIHASIHDGIRLSHAKAFAFNHNDTEDAKRLFKQSSGQVYIVVESLYSMDGDFAPLNEFAKLCAETGALMVVDEAHANGIYGPNGCGLVHEEHILEHCIARIYTFGKSIGAHGAVVVGSNMLRSYLINFARSFIYSTALPTNEILTIKHAYKFAASNPEAKQLLFNNIHYFTELASATPELKFLPASGPIQGLLFEGNERVKKAAEYIQQAGFDIRAILSPTVPEGSERLRICLHSFNSPEEIKNLFHHLTLFSKV
jgi:8-amino-7-oxononanoate synthase